MTDDLLARFPRADLGFWPTPLQRLPRLEESLGTRNRIWVKRDDCTGLAVGGNKTRKLEFLLGEALAQGCTGAVTFGALQSNHARQTAAACARLGLECHLILVRTVDRSDDHYTGSGNRLLDDLLGATVHEVDDDDAAFNVFADLFAQAEADGRKLYGIGPGGSDPVGTLGYVAGGRELAGQITDAGLDVARVVVAASTAGTAAGLVLGLASAGLDPIVDIACVYADAGHTAGSVSGLVAGTAALLDSAAPADDRWAITDRTFGPGYGVPTEASAEAIDLLARTEGVLLDPVYTAKAFAHLIATERAAEPTSAPARDVVFLHTGGSPGLFAYTPEWRR